MLTNSNGELERTEPNFYDDIYSNYFLPGSLDLFNPAIPSLCILGKLLRNKPNEI